MAEAVIMPRQGQSVETCVITQWHKNVGDPVEVGDLLFSYETDKAAFDEEAKVAGTLLARLYEEGDEVPVLKIVAVIGEKGEDISAILEEAGKEGGEATEPSDGGEETPPPPRKETPHAPAETVPAAPPVGTGGKPSAISPRARKLAEERGVDIASLTGTGPHGRIIERDVKKAIEERPRLTPLAKEKMEKDHLVPPPEKVAARERITASDLVPPETVPPAAGAYRDVPLSRLRRLIADGMFRSLRESAQLTHHTSADARKMLALRKRVKPLAKAGKMPDITLNDMVSYAVIRALVKHPEINGHFLGDKVRLFNQVHLGFAVDTERGLLVPVVRDASLLTLEGLSIRMKELAAACQSGSINPDLLAAENASFTVSNLGAFGIEYFTPVLNIPQIGILGVNTITLRPWQNDDGTVAFIPRIGLSLTYDHRAIDGAPASRFLQTLCREIENLDPQLEGLNE